MREKIHDILYYTLGNSIVRGIILVNNFGRLISNMNMNNHTKQFAIFLIIIMLAFCNQSFADVNIDASNFPDDVFRNYVKNNFDKDNDNVLDDDELADRKSTRLNSSH